MEKQFFNEPRGVLEHISGWLEHTRQLAVAAKVSGDAALASSAVPDAVKVQVNLALSRIDEGLRIMRSL